MATLPVFKVEQVSFAGTPRKVFQSSESAGRAFCPDCGASLTFETTFPEYGTLCAIHIGAFDDPESLEPTHHSFCSEQLEWFDVVDTLPRHARLVIEGHVMGHGPQKR